MQSEDLIQLTDIVLGSMLHNPNSKPKNAIIKLLCECKEEKIYPYIFTPRIRAESQSNHTQTNSSHLRKAKYNMSYSKARKYFENELNCLNGECDVPYDK
jgi:hypothetical protein